MMKLGVFKFVSLITLFLLLVACTKDSSVSKFEASAKKLCSIYAPANLNKLRDGLKTDQAFYQLIGDESRKVSDDSQFKAIFKKAFESGKPDFAVAIQDEVSALLGEEWKCKNMENFYSISFSAVDDLLNNIEPVQIILKLSQDGFLNFNNTKFKYDEPNLWQGMLQKFLISKKATDVEILVPEGKYINELTPLYGLLSDVGVGRRHVVVQDYK